MAIIYTYPKLQAPQGNELIVVTDVNNKNATRLITVASIAALVPGGGSGGCSTAITGIQTDQGNYTAPLCNEVTFTGSGITISADQATSTVTFTADPPVLACATSEKSGVVKVDQTKISVEDEIVLSTTGTHYALQVNDDCVAGVRIPTSSGYTLPCSTASILGGTKNLQNTSVSIPPQVAEEGTYYPIEVMIEPNTSSDSCRAIVKVPSSGSIACATPEDLGGIYANPVNLVTGNPSPASSGTYYPIQVITGSDEDDCFSVVRVPDNSYTLPCTTATTLGGIKAPTVTEVAVPNVAKDGTYYPVEVLSESPSGPEFDCRAVLKVPDVDIPCATSGDIGGIKVAATQGASGTVAESGTYYSLQTDENCFGVVRVPDAGEGEKLLLKSTVFETTVNTESATSAFPIPERISSTTPFGQVEFNPAVSGSGTGTEVYGSCKVPDDADGYVRVTAKFSVLNGTSGDEKLAVGLHYNNDATLTGSQIEYGWQSAGDMDSDATTGMIIQYKFTWDIKVSDLLNIDGEPTAAGDNAYFYLKVIASTETLNLLIGKQWKVNLSGLINSNEAAEPVNIDTFFIPKTSRSFNPGPPA